jgi:molecular chaperone GrpE
MSEEKYTPDVNGRTDDAAAGATEPAAETAPDSGAQSELSAVQQQLAAAETQAAEYKDQWLRSVAEFKNYKRRIEAERADLIRSASAGLVLKLLPVLDDFERAIENIPADIGATAWWGGTQLIAQKLRTILESEGVTPIAAVGQDFDPNLHEAVLYEDAPGQDGKVVAELQRGYRLNDRVLRPTMVKVGKG